MKVKCNRCGFVGEKEEFKLDRDFFQRVYICGCPKCDNRQSPAGASLNMLSGAEPFFVALKGKDELD